MNWSPCIGRHGDYSRSASDSDVVEVGMAVGRLKRGSIFVETGHKRVKCQVNKEPVKSVGALLEWEGKTVNRMKASAVGRRGPFYTKSLQRARARNAGLMSLR